MNSGWPQAVLFDLDGLLVDTQDCWDNAVRAATGKPVPDGFHPGASVADASRAFGVSAAIIEARLTEEIRGRDPRALPGAVALLTRLVTRFPLAVASNGPRAIVLELLEQLELQRFFQAVVTVDDVARGKPAPDVYLEACRRLAVSPSDSVAFEDSERGAQSAAAAGAVVIGVPLAGGTLRTADLVMRRLDDPRILSYLGLDGDGNHR